MLERDVTVRLQQRHLCNGDLRLPEVVCVAANDTADAVIENLALDAVPGEELRYRQWRMC